MKLSNVKVFLSAYLGATVFLIFTIQPRVICAGIIQIRFRPTSTVACVSVCDGVLQTPDGARPVTLSRGIMKFGWRWPRVTFWQGVLDEQLLIPVVGEKEESK